MLLGVWKRHGLIFGAGVLCVVVNKQGLGPLWYTGVALLAVGGLMRWTLARSQAPPRGQVPVPVPVQVPVAGRWMVLNGPGTKVPSHVHSHAQTYAVDLKYDPPQGEADSPAAPPFRRLRPFGRSPGLYPAFGMPVLAPGDGVVVATASRQRDHLSRSSLPGFAYLFVEGFVRSLGWPCHLLGNYILLDLGNGVYAVCAHLRRGSLRVAVGDRVTGGREIAECGNSGNSSEPHLHFQLMDGPDVMTAHGLPFEWRYRDDGMERTGVPEDFAHVVRVPSRGALAPRPDDSV
ncbi:M23 family metallopeptidase [Streptomyces sp. BE133]|uniref:M23 family metallopeptidase n=1 Tax=Streptomyces sp. BE133 TaxID=3002523 RepID=UPI002E7968F2|nr:M23 family metallopeptidase [Streptomyces sp. BE133]MEE1805640.1 M23 family metallopeptidase [Streptomyces sp. BE133]